MSYRDKYLKYKNKYLELKKMTGGDGRELDFNKVNELWEKHMPEKPSDPEKNKVTYDELKDYFSQYCWIGPPSNGDGYDYGMGFFIYRVSKEFEKNVALESLIKDKFPYLSIYYDTMKVMSLNEQMKIYVPLYAVWKITLNDIDSNIVELPSYNNPAKQNTKFQTSVPLPSKVNPIIPVPTPYWWDHGVNGWIYQVANKFYKSTLKKKLDFDEVNKLWTTHMSSTNPITFENLKPYFSEYCWIGKPNDYDFGFFIYKIKDPQTKSTIEQTFKYTVYNNKEFVPVYAVFKITLDDIKKIIQYDTDLNQIILQNYKNQENQHTKFLTPVPLLEIPVNTPYWWDHDEHSWIYQVANKFYKSTYKKQLDFDKVNMLWLLATNMKSTNPVTFENLKPYFSEYC